jgi:hypothetical protein
VLLNYRLYANGGRQVENGVGFGGYFVHDGFV